MTEVDGTLLYRDKGHLTYAGSELLGSKLALSSRLMRMAR